ncbi:RES domain-containing protein [[Mycobacterium] nativiensis]|uniref:RES domain-containing protein n=1 Tax=[Mycobacterium] nativiensis TaxID=2855503 RepID=A0ABU5XUU8_9MYCO|nr:RES domain-containing protein [Mycolicibacter sp. MYC340]MEB3031754.1 RES domain-containing protein [Mycolicibacter sp. MYC340]
MRLWRVLPWDPSAQVGQPGHPLWVPREFQGVGRHDAPDLYGAIYLAEKAVSAIAETLAPFRGTGDLHPAMLARSGRQLALAEVELAASAALVDLDDPPVLVDEGLRPSVIATRERSVTQTYAAELFAAHPDAAGLRWWSTLEASWLQATLFDRALTDLDLGELELLSVDHWAVQEAAEILGLA